MLDPTHGLAVFTDGSAWLKNHSGGWAWVAVDDAGKEARGCGYVHDTTNNRMEMQAVIEALKWIATYCGPSEILVNSDSEYVVLGAQNPRRNRNKNRDLWNQINESIAAHEYVEFEHVRGHHDSYYNNEADRLAGAIRKAGSYGIARKA